MTLDRHARSGGSRTAGWRSCHGCSPGAGAVGAAGIPVAAPPLALAAPGGSERRASDSESVESWQSRADGPCKGGGRHCFCAGQRTNRRRPRQPSPPSPQIVAGTSVGAGRPAPRPALELAGRVHSAAGRWVGGRAGGKEASRSGLPRGQVQPAGRGARAGVSSDPVFWLGMQGPSASPRRSCAGRWWASWLDRQTARAAEPRAVVRGSAARRRSAALPSPHPPRRTHAHIASSSSMAAARAREALIAGGCRGKRLEVEALAGGLRVRRWGRGAYGGVQGVADWRVEAAFSLPSVAASHEHRPDGGPSALCHPTAHRVR